MIPQAVRALVVGFGVATAIATVVWFVAYRLGAFTRVEASTGDLTNFIIHPDGWSFVVACLAGIAGTLSLTTAKSGPLVGVFISITTIPAVGTVAVCLACGVWGEAASALAAAGHQPARPADRRYDDPGGAAHRLAPGRQPVTAPRADAMSDPAHEPIPPNRWELNVSSAHDASYAECFEDLIERGQDIDGEARLADVLAPRRARDPRRRCGHGPGRGRAGARGHDVTAVEKDPDLVARSRARFPDVPVVESDILGLSPLSSRRRAGPRRTTSSWWSAT